MTDVADAIVVGAGIVGAACADALAQDGWRVRVLERARPGGRATAAGMGHVLVLDDSEAQFALTRLGRDLWRARDWPPSVERDDCGTIWVAADDAEFDAARGKSEWYAARGVRTGLLDARALRDAEPELHEGLRGGLHIADDLVVHPPTATAHLLACARAHGALVEPLRSVRVVGDGNVELDDDTRLSAALVVVAAGLDTPRLLGHRPDALRIRAKKGHLVISDRAPGFVRHQLVELGYLKSAHGGTARSVAFNAQPRRSGQLLLGSSRQVDVVEPRVEHDMLAAMIARAMRFLPRIGSLPGLRVWTGLRPSTDDNLPFIGRLPDAPRTIVAAGHEGLGITTSLSTAKLVADLAADRTPCIDPRWFACDRSTAELAHG
ncbi:MAG: FAD-binding oxidoreductase [Planctomycetes bacterium]|nr:FAD-binding oxidoreductase [Planctomycetota bacterium]